jgi:hypothetical protein
MAIACLVTACGESPSIPSGQGPSALVALTGSVTESAPTTTTPIPGAVLTFADGANAGRSIQTDQTGAFSITALQSGRFTLNVAANGYQATDFPVMLSPTTTIQTFRLRPMLRVTVESLSGMLSKGDAPCFDIGDPCQRYTFTLHHTNELNAVLIWPSVEAALLILQWYDVSNNRVLLEEANMTAPRQQISTAVGAPGIYQLRVVAARLVSNTNFSLSVTHSN